MPENNTNFTSSQKAYIRNTSHSTLSVLIKPYYQTQIGVLKFFAYFYLFIIRNNKVKRERTIRWNSMYENETYNNEANYFRRNVGSEKKMTNFLEQVQYCYFYLCLGYFTANSIQNDLWYFYRVIDVEYFQNK